MLSVDVPCAYLFSVQGRPWRSFWRKGTCFVPWCVLVTWLSTSCGLSKNVVSLNNIICILRVLWETRNLFTVTSSILHQTGSGATDCTMFLTRSNTSDLNVSVPKAWGVCCMQSGQFAKNWIHSSYNYNDWFFNLCCKMNEHIKETIVSLRKWNLGTLTVSFGNALVFSKIPIKIPLPEFDVVVRICFYKLHNNDRPEIVCTSVEGITLSKTKLLKISRGKNGRQINLTSTWRHFFMIFFNVNLGKFCISL